MIRIKLDTLISLCLSEIRMQHLIYDPFGHLPDKFDTVIDGHGEHFVQDISVVESKYYNGSGVLLCYRNSPGLW